MNYTEQWKKVAGYEAQSLPKSAAKEVDAILKRAITDKNAPQVIKALIHEGKYDLAADAENDTLIFHRLDEMLLKSGDVTEKAVLHSMLGELYLHYYRQDAWNIDQRTELQGYVPQDMKEWSRNIFFDKATEHLNASLASRQELERTKVESYEVLVDMQPDSRRLFPTMYDFLARRAVELFAEMETGGDVGAAVRKKGIAFSSLYRPAEKFVTLSFAPEAGDYLLWQLETHRKLLSSLMEREMDESVLLTDLDRLNYLSRFPEAYGRYARPMLESLLSEWKEQAVSVEITDRLAEQYEQEIRLLPLEDSVLQKQRTGELYEMLSSAIRRFPDYKRIALLQNRLSQLTRTGFSVSGNKTYTPAGKKEFTVTFRNLKALTARLYRIDSSVAAIEAVLNGRKPDQKELTFVKELPIVLPEEPPYWEGNATFSLDIDQPGCYLLSPQAYPRTEETERGGCIFSVSDLALFTRSEGKESSSFFVVDRTAGAPVKGANVLIYKQTGSWRNYGVELLATLPTDANGKAQYHGKHGDGTLLYQAVSGKDRYAIISPMERSYDERVEGMKTEKRVHLFCDRSLYRPGQTLYLKAIATTSSATGVELLENESLEFVLRDANRREIAKKRLKTNEYGSASTEFVLPKGVLPGSFTLICNQKATLSFRVEEYKRPTFSISFHAIEKSYTFGEEIMLKGKAENFSGVRLQQLPVSYRITRQQSWWRSWQGAVEQVEEGTVTTDADGAFTIAFIPEKPDRKSMLRCNYTYTVETTVTDLNGETQTGSYAVTVGEQSMLLQVHMPGQWEKNSTEKIRITAVNLNGNPLAAKGTWRIVSLAENDVVSGEMAQGSFETGEQPAVQTLLTGLPSGKYRLLLQSKDDRGKPVEAEKTFILFSYKDAAPPITTDAWFLKKKETFAPGSAAEVILGASGEIHVLYEVWRGKNLLEQKWLMLNHENRHFTFLPKPEYGGGITVRFTYVKAERFHSHFALLRLEAERKELKVQLEVFRDKIRPGTEEEWRVAVKDIHGRPASAELLASMYDISLDPLFAPHTWLLNPYPLSDRLALMPFYTDRSFGNMGCHSYRKTDDRNIDAYRFDRFNWFGFSLFGMSRRKMLRSGGGMPEPVYMSVAEADAGMGVAGENKISADDVLAEEAVMVTERSSEAPLPPALEVPETAAADQPQLRRNFHETAFFYPHLRTNEEGETLIAFTVPESNSGWRFRVVAHDKKLNVGNAEALTVSRKELMVTPDRPRFLRQGDRTSISAKISNLSKEMIEGTATITLFDPVTDETVTTISVTPEDQPFSIGKGASTTVTWRFDVPSDRDLLGIRIVARSEGFSDGEEHALAVLPNRMLVTESLRMDLDGNETKRYSMPRVAENSVATATAENYRLTLEFASNPAWYAVQALPVLSTPDSENTVSRFASFYVNTLAAHIGKSYPKVTAMIDAWQKEGGDRETLRSQLEKNEALKEVLLEETPWVLEANNESEQKEKLSLLFDLNRSRHLTTTALEKLKELQTSRGGWPWFKEMVPSRSITRYILYGFAQLKELGIKSVSEGDIPAICSRAVGYLDEEALRAFEEMKKRNKRWRNTNTLATSEVEYLYVRSFYPEQKMEPSVREMVDFYTCVAEKNRMKFGMYERSLIAVLMQRNGKKQPVTDILNSFREHATHSDELGMFWANNRARVFMSQSAVTMHTFIMEAFRVGGATTGEMDAMKRWLLKQKQTQLWESTHATTDAVYALLSTGSDWFAAEGTTDITLGNRKIERASAEKGTGYHKSVWMRNDIRLDMGDVSVSHRGKGPAWGALYLQYFEELDKIGKTDASLDVEKQLFVEETGAAGRKLVPITERRPLKVGDKAVVRLTVRTDRDLDFVHLKDMRAVCFEPEKQISGIRWQNGIPCYQTSKDVATHYYFDFLPRGTYLFEYAVYVNRSGSYSNGITSIQCMYAPEFTSHTAGMRIEVKE